MSKQLANPIVQIGGKYYAEAPEGGPEGGKRSTLTLLFPKK